MIEALEPWKDFNVAMAGACGALAGLIIVAVSVNIKEILASRSQPARAGVAIGTLVMVVAVACLGLMPDVPLWLYGVEVLALAAVLVVLQAFATVRLVTETGKTPFQRVVTILTGVVPVALFVLGAALLVLGLGAGLFVLAWASIASIVFAILFSWVALVEVLR